MALALVSVDWILHVVPWSRRKRSGERFQPLPLFLLSWPLEVHQISDHRDCLDFNDSVPLQDVKCQPRTGARPQVLPLLISKERMSRWLLVIPVVPPKIIRKSHGSFSSYKIRFVFEIYVWRAILNSITKKMPFKKRRILQWNLHTTLVK